MRSESGETCVDARERRGKEIVAFGITVPASFSFVAFEQCEGFDF